MHFLAHPAGCIVFRLTNALLLWASLTTAAYEYVHKAESTLLTKRRGVRFENDVDPRWPRSPATACTQSTSHGLKSTAHRPWRTVALQECRLSELWLLPTSCRYSAVYTIHSGSNLIILQSIPHCCDAGCCCCWSAVAYVGQSGGMIRHWLLILLHTLNKLAIPH